nr:dihydroneopterin aldolase [Propionibacterium sp.]
MSGDGLELIRLVGVTARGRHGYLPAEKRDGQPFSVDLVLALRRAADDDALAGTADYGEIAAGVVRLIEGDPVDLIETLAQQVAAFCLGFPAVSGVVCTVHKPEAPIGVPFADAAVTVVRTRP